MDRLCYIILECGKVVLYHGSQQCSLLSKDPVPIRTEEGAEFQSSV